MALSKKYRCLNVGNCETANQNKVFEIAEGNEPVCPDCGKNMLVEVKAGKPMRIIFIIVAIIAVLAAIYCVVGINKNEEAQEAPAEAEEQVAEVVPDETALEVIDEAAIDEEVAEPEEVKDAVIEDLEKKAATERPATAANSLSGYNLGWGKYSGPASNGKPNGLGGEIAVTARHTLNLNDGGKTIEFTPGDKITDVKMKDGKLVQGLLTRADNTSRYFSVGV